MGNIEYGVLLNRISIELIIKIKMYASVLFLLSNEIFV